MFETKYDTKRTGTENVIIAKIPKSKGASALFRVLSPVKTSRIVVDRKSSRLGRIVGVWYRKPVRRAGGGLSSSNISFWCILSRMDGPY